MQDGIDLFKVAGGGRWRVAGGGRFERALFFSPKLALVSVLNGRSFSEKNWIQQRKFIQLKSRTYGRKSSLVISNPDMPIV